jgi:hypothetical protein
MQRYSMSSRPTQARALTRGFLLSAAVRCSLLEMRSLLLVLLYSKTKSQLGAQSPGSAASPHTCIPMHCCIWVLGLAYASSTGCICKLGMQHTIRYAGEVSFPLKVDQSYNATACRTFLRNTHN